MEQYDLDLISKHSGNNKELASLYAEHLDFEKRLERYKNKSHLTTEEELVRKTLQKKKLQGRDLMEKILFQIKRNESN